MKISSRVSGFDKSKINSFTLGELEPVPSNVNHNSRPNVSLEARKSIESDLKSHSARIHTCFVLETPSQRGCRACAMRNGRWRGGIVGGYGDESVKPQRAFRKLPSTRSHNIAAYFLIYPCVVCGKIHTCSSPPPPYRENIIFE